MKLDSTSNQVYVVALNEARLQNHEYITPEHFLYASLMFDAGKSLVQYSGGDLSAITDELNFFFENKVPRAPGDAPSDSYAFTHMLELALARIHGRNKDTLTLADILAAIFNLHESHAAYIMAKNGVDPMLLTKAADANAEAKTQAAQSGSMEFLSAYTVNLSERAKKGQLDPLVGRSEILDRTIQILCRRLKNNPIHVGDPGVGKTAIVEGLAQRIANGKIPGALAGAEIFSVDMGAMVAGTKYRGDFEERMVKLLDILRKRKRAILYIDEIHTVVGAGAVSGGGMDATSMIKPYLAAGELRFIGSTTFDEYKKYFEKDRALSRRFQRIDVNEPGVLECAEILRGLKSKYEEFHHVKYTDEILRLICELSAKYMNDRYLPDKAIDVMDETGAAIHMSGIGSCTVSAGDIERTVSLMAKIPESTVSGDEAGRLLSLEENLRKQIFGQDHAIDAVVSAIKASRSGLNDPDKPVANLLFVGPTGVGKTEIARRLAFHLAIGLERFDMSEYQEKHAVARLIGAPPGYVGYESGGLLTEAIRKRPNAVLLLDEIEKAHADILNVLLQIMDYGTLTDNEGRKADFRHVVIIMTSNAGASDLHKKRIGYHEKDDTDALDRAVERVFSPEFRNRLDAVVPFRKVDEEMAQRIAAKALGALAEKLARKNVSLTYTQDLLRHVARTGLSAQYGAREIMRVVDKDVKKRLIDTVLFGSLSKGGSVLIDAPNGEITLQCK